MSALFASGHAVDIILALTAAEATGIVLLHRSGHGPNLDVLVTLLSGVGLLVALRCALVGAWWGWIGLWLLVALVAHVVDLASRKKQFFFEKKNQKTFVP
jgi:hypothetical protein